MKFLFLIFFITSSKFCFSIDKNKFVISPTASLLTSIDKTKFVRMSSLQTTTAQLENSFGRKEIELLLIHSAPESYANLASIERKWKLERAATQEIDKNEKDYGCRRMSSRSFSCSRNVIQDKKFITEKILWNAKNDLILLRVYSYISHEEVKKIIDKIDFKFNSRIKVGRNE